MGKSNRKPLKDSHNCLENIFKITKHDVFPALFFPKFSARLPRHVYCSRGAGKSRFHLLPDADAEPELLQDPGTSCSTVRAKL
jgi:hypothetical protein